jgi:hypothetical protein
MCTQGIVSAKSTVEAEMPTYSKAHYTLRDGGEAAPFHPVKIYILMEWRFNFLQLL